MHVIINILFYCKLRNIYGLKWTTTSKRSSPPRGREWKICLNMKVVKWVAAHTGMFIKRSVKTGKRHAIDWRASAVTDVRVCRGNYAVISTVCDCFCFHGRTSAVHPQTNVMFSVFVQEFTCLYIPTCSSSCVHISTSAGVYVLRCSAVYVFRNPAVLDVQEFRCSVSSRAH